MPLHKSVTINNDTQLLVWKITESHDELFKQVRLKDICLARVEGMKSEQHQRGFLSVRMLLMEAGYTDFDLYYAEDGKPHLKDGKNISITHSYEFSAVIISNRNVGIDMEMRRAAGLKTIGVDSEFSYLKPEQQSDYIRMLTVIWGVKEALFKMISLPGISFKQHIDVDAFGIEDDGGTAIVTFENMNSSYTFLFEEIEDFTLVYSFEALNL